VERRGDRPTNLDQGPLAGDWLYTDFPGAPPVHVEICFELGTCIVRFPPLDGDEGADVPFEDIAAKKSWREHFTRTRERKKAPPLTRVPAVKGGAVRALKARAGDN